MESTTRKRKFNTLVKRAEDRTEKEVQVPAQQNAEMYMITYNRWINRIILVKVNLKQCTHDMYNYYIYNYKTYRSIDLSLWIYRFTLTLGYGSITPCYCGSTDL
jgi:hypothetical protein